MQVKTPDFFFDCFLCSSKSNIERSFQAISVTSNPKSFKNGNSNLPLISSSFISTLSYINRVLVIFYELRKSQILMKLSVIVVVSMFLTQENANRFVLKVSSELVSAPSYRSKDASFCKLVFSL